MVQKNVALPVGGAISLLLGVGLPIVIPQTNPIVGWILIGLAAMLIVFWLGLVFGKRTEDAHHFHFHFGDLIREELRAILPKDGRGRGALPAVVVTPPEGVASAGPDQAPITGRLEVVEEPDTCVAAGVVTPVIPKLYVGQMIFSASRLNSDEPALEIAVRAFNGSQDVLRVLRVDGCISAGINNANGTPLPTPAWKPEHNADPIPPGSEFLVIMDQMVSDGRAKEWLEALEKSDYIAFDLRQLNVVVETEDAPHVRAPLPLWNGATIRRRDDIVTGRIIMASLNITMQPLVSLSASISKDSSDGVDKPL